LPSQAPPSERIQFTSLADIDDRDTGAVDFRSPWAGSCQYEDRRLKPFAINPLRQQRQLLLGASFV
jgi:hypothetical protein